MKAILTGATSFLGKEFLKQIIDLYDEIICFVRPNSQNKKNIIAHDKITIIYDQLDNIDKHKFENVVAFFHFAWEGTRFPEREDQDLQEHNFLLSKICIDYCVHHKIRKFFCVGSQAEYGIKSDVMCEYENKESPNSQYGINKLRTLRYLQKIDDPFFTWSWGRVFSAYGENDYKNTLVMTAIEKMLKDEDCFLGDPDKLWNYIYIEDLVYLLKRVAIDGIGIYNLAGEETKSIRDFVYDIKECLNSKSNIYFDKTKKFDVGGLNPSIVRIKEDFNFTYQYTFKKGIIDMLSKIKSI